MKDPQPIEIEEAEVEQLIQKAQQGTLNAAEQKRLVPLLKTLVWLERTLLETRISLSKLKRILFGKKTEKRSRKPKDPDPGDEGDGSGESGGSGSDESSGSNDAAAGTTAATSGLLSDEQTGNRTPRSRAVMVAERRRIIPVLRRFLVPSMGIGRGIGVRCASAAGFTRSGRWYACVLPVSHWHW